MPEISWFAGVFLLDLCCVVWRHLVTIERMPHLWWSVSVCQPNRLACLDKLCLWAHKQSLSRQATKQVCSLYASKELEWCFIWVTNLGTIHGEVQPNFFFLRQTTKLRHFFIWCKEPSNQTIQHKTNQQTGVNKLI